jgi:hypothetical protein
MSRWIAALVLSVSLAGTARRHRGEQRTSLVEAVEQSRKIEALRARDAEFKKSSGARWPLFVIAETREKPDALAKRVAKESDVPLEAAVKLIAAWNSEPAAAKAKDASAQDSAVLAAQTAQDYVDAALKAPASDALWQIAAQFIERWRLANLPAGPVSAFVEGGAKYRERVTKVNFPKFLRWQILAVALPSDPGAALALLTAGSLREESYYLEAIGSEIAWDAARVVGDRKEREKALARRLEWLIFYGQDDGLQLFRSASPSEQDAVFDAADTSQKERLRIGLAAAAALQGDAKGARSLLARKSILWRLGGEQERDYKGCNEFNERVLLAAAAPDPAEDPYDLLASECAPGGYEVGQRLVANLARADAPQFAAASLERTAGFSRRMAGEMEDLEEERLGTDPFNADTDGDGIPDGQDPLPQVADDGKPDATTELLATVIRRLSGGGESNALITGIDTSGDDKIHTPKRSLSTDPAGGRTTFIVADRALLKSLPSAERIAVLTPAEMELARRKFGTFFPMDLEVIKSRDGRRAHVIWDASWTGGSFEATLVEGRWQLKVVRSWIT